MILKYDKEKIYDPNALKNQVRRMTKVTAKRSYQRRLPTNKVLLLLLNLPLVKQTLQLTLALGNKILPLLENNDIERKGDYYGISESRQTSSGRRCSSCGDTREL